MEMNRKPVYGSLLDYNELSGGSSYISVPGVFKNSKCSVNIDQDILSKHILLSGGTGSGKTNAFYHIISQLKRKMTSDDVMIIFDTKGDYYNRFFSPSDLVIGNSKEYRDISEKWNVYREILSDGWDEHEIDNNIQEISWSIFREAIDRSKESFFPNAARDLFAGILLCLMESGRNDTAFKKRNFYNVVLKKSLDSANVIQIKKMLDVHPNYSSVGSYIGDGKNGQALGVYAEMIASVRKILTGVFAEKGSFSVRDFVRSRGGRTLYIEYDMSLGDTLAPLYSLLIDLMLKEVLGRSKQTGNVYMIFDEFRLLPYLQHIDDGVNFGRSLGLKIMAGIQSVNQIIEAYGESRGKSILSGFSTVLAFRANDADTRKYITELFGENIVLEQRKTLANVISEEQKIAHVVEDWDVRDLKIGEAIIGFPCCNPFRFQFDEYK